MSEGAFKGNVIATIQDALVKCIAAEPIEKTIKTAAHDKLIKGYTFKEQIKAALDAHIISKEEYKIVTEAEEARNTVIAVDDFAPEDLARTLIRKTAQSIPLANEF